MAAGQAQDQILRADSHMIAVGFHGGDQFLVLIPQQFVQVYAIQQPLMGKCCHGQLRSTVACAASHTQQAAIHFVRTGFRRCQRIGLRKTQIAVAVESHGNARLFFQCFDIGGCFVRVHGSGGVHDGNDVDAGLCQHFCFLRQLLGGANIGLHHGVPASQAGCFDHFHGLCCFSAVTGRNAYPNKIKAVVLDHFDLVRIGKGGQHEHAQTPLIRIAGCQLGIALVIQRSFRAAIIAADSLGVAHFNVLNAAVQKPADHAFRQL